MKMSQEMRGATEGAVEACLELKARLIKTIAILESITDCQEFARMARRLKWHLKRVEKGICESQKLLSQGKK